MSTPASSQGQPAAPQNGLGTAALILGILGVIGCLPYVGSILGIVLGKMGMTKADQGLATNGFILGIIGIILAVIGTIIYIVVIVGAAASGNLEMTTN